MKMNPFGEPLIRRGLLAASLAGALTLTMVGCGPDTTEVGNEAQAISGQITKGTVTDGVTFRYSPHVFDQSQNSNACMITNTSFHVDAQPAPIRRNDPDSDWIGLPADLPAFEGTDCADDNTGEVWFSVSDKDLTRNEGPGTLRGNFTGDYNFDIPVRSYTPTPRN